MLAAARRSLSAISSKAPYVQAAATRSMGNMEGVKGFNEHEQAVENMYFNKVGWHMLIRELPIALLSMNGDTPAALPQVGPEQQHTHTPAWHAASTRFDCRRTSACCASCWAR